MENNNNVESASKTTEVKEAAKVEENLDNKNTNSTIQGLETRKLVGSSVLLESGIQVGMSTKRWNPKMKPFIYKKKTNLYNKNSYYVIDLTKIMVFLNNAYKFLSSVSQNHGSILFVGTKKSAAIRDLIKEEAKRTQSHYVTQRWLGGTLTNFRTLSNSIKKLNDLVALQKFGEIEEKYTKKEQICMLKETERLNKFVGGIRLMNTLPQALIVIDPVADQNAIKEAKSMHIPVVALANTNADPSNIDFIIPCNNMSLRSLTLVLTILADAICEGRGEPTKFVGKEDSEIQLPEAQKRNTNLTVENIVNHKNFSKTPKKASVDDLNIQQNSEIKQEQKIEDIKE